MTSLALLSASPWTLRETPPHSCDWAPDNVGKELVPAQMHGSGERRWPSLPLSHLQPVMIEAALLPRDLVSPAVLEGHNCSATTAREGGWGNHSHSARAGYWARQSARKVCHERERDLTAGHGVLSGLVVAPPPKLAVDAGRKRRVPGLGAVLSCLSSLSRRYLAWVPEEGRETPVSQQGLAFICFL